MKRLIALAVVVLAGCATPPECKPIEKPIEVKIPVPVPCKINAPAAPALPVDGTPGSAAVDVKVRAALDSLDLERGYAGQLEAAISACQ